jgi:putative hydrolase of the HAD superfamily
MVGNSLRSDILPVVELGGTAIHIPYHLTWRHEHVDESALPGDGWHRLETIRELGGLLAGLDRNGVSGQSQELQSPADR